TAVTVTALHFSGVRAADQLAFGGYLLCCLTVPGTLLWRGLRGGPGLLVADLAAGTVLGYAVEVLSYLAARPLGAPRLVLLGPAMVILACLLRPRWRRHWRGSGQRVPLWWAWSLTAVVGFVLAFSAATFWRSHGLTWPASGSPYQDMPFHLALAGELKHHVPPTIPYVSGEPLNYHWFVYADLAATSWVSGVELDVLLYRLSVLPMAGLTTVLVALLAQQVTGRGGRAGPWWPGPLAAALFLLATAPNPYGWTAGPVATGAPLDVLWLSPTQTFGALLALPLVLVLVDLLRAGAGHPGPTPGRWLLLVLLLAVTTGAKATLLPMLLAALVLVVAVHAAAFRRLHRPAAAAGVLVAVALAFAQAVLFAGFSGGLAPQPLQTALLSPVATVSGLVTSGRAVGSTPAWVVLFATVLCLGCWLGIGIGALGLVSGRRARAGPVARPAGPAVRPADPGVLLCAGMVAAGVAAALTFSHPGASQMYFFVSARPYLAVLAVAGIAAVLPAAPAWAGRTRRRGRLLLAAAVLAGVAATGLLRAWTGDTPPAAHPAGAGHVALAGLLALPYAVLVALGALGWVAVRRLPARTVPGRPLAWPAVLLFATGTALPGVSQSTAGPVFAVLDAASHGWRATSPGPGSTRPAIPDGAVAAGRWLRRHSDPADVVATNVHCLVIRPGGCDNRHFWVAAYTERRVLVEGWGYTVRAHRAAQRTGVPPALVPYWDAERLAANDAVFRAPSAEAATRLRRAYGVRWLLVDRRVNPPAATLAGYAALRLRAADCEVYELTG
ncbi:MAG TPA: hypothetical protein VF755_28745, partial [Catenuloplanes sp.]